MKNWRIYIEKVLSLYFPFIMEVNKILHKEKDNESIVFELKTLIYDLEYKMNVAHEEFLTKNIFHVRTVKKIEPLKEEGIAGNIKYCYSLN